MSLNRMSLGNQNNKQEKKQKIGGWKAKRSDIFTHQNLNYLKSTEDDEDYGERPPCLHLASHDTIITLTKNDGVSVERVFFNEFDLYSNYIEVRSKYSIIQGMYDSFDLRLKDKSNTQDFYDVGIIGSLCEALCKASLSIDILEENSELIEQWINETLKFYDLHSESYQFNYERAIGVLTNNLSNSEVELLDEYPDSKSFILFKKAEDESYSSSTVLYVNSQEIVLEKSKQEKVIFSVPSNIAASKLKCSDFNYLYDAMVWFLLAKNGFYYNYKNGYFYTDDEVPEHKLHIR